MPSAKEELQALWTAVFKQPPVVEADPSLLAALIVRCSAPPPPYGAPIPVDEPLTRPDDTSAPCDR
jgi:hypothetical protein